MPKLINRFQKLYPTIDLTFVDLVSYEEIDKALLENRINVTMTIGNNLAKKEGIHFLTIEKEQPTCSIMADHPIAQKESLAIQDLRGMAVCTIAKGFSNWHDSLNKYIKAHEPSINIIEITSNEKGILRLQQPNTVGIGAPIVTPTWLEGRVMLPFEPPQGVQERISVDLATSMPDSPLLTSFLNAARYVAKHELIGDHFYR